MEFHSRGKSAALALFLGFSPVMPVHLIGHGAPHNKNNERMLVFFGPPAKESDIYVQCLPQWALPGKQLMREEDFLMKFKAIILAAVLTVVSGLSAGSGSSSTTLNGSYPIILSHGMFGWGANDTNSL